MMSSTDSTPLLQPEPVRLLKRTHPGTLGWQEIIHTPASSRLARRGGVEVFGRPKAREADKILFALTPTLRPTL